MTVMHPQNVNNLRLPHQHHQQQFTHQPQLDNSPYFNIDPSAAAKQFAALNVANMTRIANGRSAHQLSPPTAQPPPYLASPASSNTHSTLGSTHDATNAPSHTNFHLPNQNGQPPFPSASSSLLDASIPLQQNMASRNTSSPSIAASLKQRRRNFLMGLAGVMSGRNVPLPPALTGVPYPPGYDPTNSPWKTIDISLNEPGFFRLAGKDVDVFKLWGLVFNAGGGAKLNSQPGAWNMLLQHLDLPEHFPIPQPNGQTSVAATLSQYYMAILHPFEDAYKRNVQEQHRRAVAASRQSGSQPQSSASAGSTPRRATQTPQNGVPQPNFPGQIQGGGATLQVPGLASQSNMTSSSLNGNSQFPHSANPPPTLAPASHLRPPSSVTNTTGNDTSLTSAPDPISVNPVHGFTTQSSEKDILDPEVQGIKRKLDPEDSESKRVRQKTAEAADLPDTSSAERSSLPPASSSIGPNGTSTKVPQPPQTRLQPSRRKIEYVPLAREIETYGGRDLNAINEELTRLRDRRPLRDINDWGIVDIEALTMSLRSRLATELSYALTTFTLLSTMKGQTPGSGFPIYQCVDLLDELLDLLEEEAFGEEGSSEQDIPEDIPTTTHRELVNIIHEDGNQPFASLECNQGSTKPNDGPRQRPGNYILAVTNIIRNLSTIMDNVAFLAQHKRLLDTMLRVCDVRRDGHRPYAASSVLSLGDLVTVHKDTLYTLTNIAGMVHFNPSLSETTTRAARRVFALISSYLIDPAECHSPATYLLQIAHLPSNGRKPSSLTDIALEVFTRMSLADSNRQVFSRAIPQKAIWRLFEALVHRLPVLDADFQVVTREYWLSYLEKIVMSIYSLAFLSPPELKQKIKTDRKLCFSKVMLRVVQKFLSNSSPEGRAWFSVCTRRAIEAMKIVDDCEDSFDTSQPATLPTMSFGMGYGEVGESEKEKGTGLLGGYRDVTWDLLMLREVDDVFSELESLARVD